MNKDAVENGEAYQVIASSQVKFENPHPDVHVARIFIASASWVITPDGTVVVDTLLYPGVAEKMKAHLPTSSHSSPVG